MTNVHGCAFFSLKKIKELPKCNEEFFLLESLLQNLKFIFRQSESCVLMMSSWSRRVKIRWLKSSIEAQLPTVSGNLKKMLYSCSCTSFVSCYCVWRRKQTKTVLAGFSQKSQKRVPWFSVTSPGQIQISRQKTPIFVFAALVSNCRINYRQTQTHTHTQTHTWFDQGQLTIQLILQVIELIQEVKTTRVYLIKMGNRFSYQHLKNDISISHFHTDFIFNTVMIIF